MNINTSNRDVRDVGIAAGVVILVNIVWGFSSDLISQRRVKKDCQAAFNAIQDIQCDIRELQSLLDPQSVPNAEYVDSLFAKVQAKISKASPRQEEELKELRSRWETSALYVASHIVAAGKAVDDYVDSKMVRLEKIALDKVVGTRRLVNAHGTTAQKAVFQDIFDKFHNFNVELALAEKAADTRTTAQAVDTLGESLDVCQEELDKLSAVVFTPEQIQTVIEGTEALMDHLEAAFPGTASIVEDVLTSREIPAEEVPVEVKDLGTFANAAGEAVEAFSALLEDTEASTKELEEAQSLCKNALKSFQQMINMLEGVDVTDHQYRYANILSCYELKLPALKKAKAANARKAKTVK